MLKVAAVQYDLTGGLTLPGFLSKVEAFAAEAASHGAELVVLPELIATDLFDNDDPTAEGELRSISRIVTEAAPRYLEALPVLAKKLGIAILGGSLPRQLGEGIVNTAPLAFANGSQILQDKVFLTSCERADWAWKPGKGLRVFNAPWGRTVISICLDTEMPALSELLVEQRPEVILVPSCTSSIHGFRRVRWTAQARAIEHFAFVVHAGTVGPGTKTVNMNEQYGQAALLTPSDVGFDGIQAEGPLNQRGMVVGELNIGRLRRRRPEATVYPAQHQLDRADSPRILSSTEFSEL